MRSLIWGSLINFRQPGFPRFFHSNWTPIKIKFAFFLWKNETHLILIDKKTVQDRTEENRIGSRSLQGQSSELFPGHQNKRQIVNKITEAKVGTVSTLTNFYRTVLVLEEVLPKMAVVRPEHSPLLDTLDTPVLGVPMMILFIAKINYY